MQQLLAVNPQVKFIATPWSPPGWMKANDALNSIGGAGTLLPRAYGPLTQYFVKFVEAYALRGIYIYAVAPENEPGQPALYPSMNLSERDEAAFISQYLAPALAAVGCTRTSTATIGSGWSGDVLSPWPRTQARSRI